MAKQSYLGIDLGATSIKVVELANDAGRAKLVTYGFTARKSYSLQENFLDDPERAVSLIKEVCKKAKTTTTKTVAALPVASVFSSIVSIPTIEEKDMVSAVRWEAKKIIPMPIEKMILDWKVLEKVGEGSKGQEGAVIQPPASVNLTTGKEKTRQILLTAADRDLVQKHVDIFKQAGLTLASLETEAFALVRSLVGNDKSSVMIVDIGAEATNLSIVDQGIPYINRSIDLGGESITKRISEVLGVGLDQAEELKYDLGASQKKGSYNLSVPFQEFLTALINEINYCFTLYQSQKLEESKNIEKIILSGGTSLLANLVDHLAKELKIRVFVGDPWARVIYPEDLKPVLNQIGPQFAIAVGLAMREIS